MSERHYYEQDGIPGGIECDGCGEVNTCYFVEGYWIAVNDGREYHETIECEDCGTRMEGMWTQKAPYPVGTDAVSPSEAS